MPLQSHVRLGIGIGKFQLRHLHPNLLIAHLPAHSGLKTVQAHIGLCKDAWRREHQRRLRGIHAQLGLPTILVQTEAGIEPFNAGNSYFFRAFA